MTHTSQVTAGSWWRNTQTGQRLIVPADLQAFRTGHFMAGKIHGCGRTEGMVPFYAEGESLYMRWLTREELLAGHRRYRPARKNRIPAPPWVYPKSGQINEFLLDTRFQCSILGVRGSLIALAGMDPPEQALYDWGTVRYTTRFIQTGPELQRLQHRFNPRQLTSWDLLVS